MTRISFYTFREGLDDGAALHWTCRLIQKIAGQAPVWIHVGTQELDALDRALWTFDPSAFLAHRRVEDAHDPLSRVVLVGVDDAPSSTNGHPDRAPGGANTTDDAAGDALEPLAAAPADAVLVNLALALPRSFARFERVADVVGASTAARDAGRTRFRFLRERGYPLEHHVLG